MSSLTAITAAYHSNALGDPVAARAVLDDACQVDAWHQEARAISDPAQRKAIYEKITAQYLAERPRLAVATHERLADLPDVISGGVVTLGIALTAAALLEMPLLGRVKHKLGQRLGSGATTGEGTQNYLCAAQAAAAAPPCTPSTCRWHRAPEK